MSLTTCHCRVKKLKPTFLLSPFKAEFGEILSQWMAILLKKFHLSTANNLRG